MDQVDVRQSGKPLEEVDCFKYLGSQVAADGEYEGDVVHRMNKEYKGWEALKRVPSNRRLGINEKQCMCCQNISFSSSSSSSSRRTDRCVHFQQNAGL